MMFLVVTLLVWLVLIKLLWKPVPSPITLMPVPSEPWNIPYLPSWELPLTVKMLLIYPNWLMVWKNYPNLILWLSVLMKNPDNKLLLVAENCTSKSVWKIWKNSPDVPSLNPTPSFLTKKPLPENPTKFVCPNPPTNITESMLKLKLWKKTYPKPSRKTKLPPKMMLNKDPNSCMKNMVGTENTVVLNYGISDPIMSDLTYWLMPPKVSNTWTKSKILVNLLGNGPPEKPFWLKKEWEESESTC